MRKLLPFLFGLAFISLSAWGAYQHIGNDLIVGTRQKPDDAAALQVESTTKGFLPPRVTQAQKLAISSPPAGLMVYNTTLGQIEIYSGGVWSAIGGGGADHPIWTADTAYGEGAIIIDSTVYNKTVYRANTGHTSTSSVFGDDFALGYWDEISNNINNIASGTAINNAVLVWDGTTGDVVKSSPLVADELGDVTGVHDLTATGTITVGNLQASVNTIQSTDTDGNIILAPEGAGNGDVIIQNAGTGTGTGVYVKLKGDNNFVIDGSTDPRTITEGAIRQLHTAGTVGTRANYIIVDPAGYDDVRGLAVRLNLASETNDIRPKGINLTADITNAQNQEVNYIEVDKIGQVDSSVDLHALHVTGGIWPIDHQSGVHRAADQNWIYDGAYTDANTAFGSDGTNLTLFTNNGDYVYVGYSAKFTDIEVILNTVSSKTIIPTFEYSKGASVWGTVAVTDGTNGFTENGNILITAPADWVADTVNGSSQFWIRIARTRAGAIATLPIESTVQISETVSYYWDASGSVLVDNLTAGNLKIASNSVISTDANGDIILDPNGSGQVAMPDLAADSILVLNSSSEASASVLTNGQLLIGSTGSGPVPADLTGTANQITVTGGAGSITLSTPQDIATSSTPTFSSEILTNDLSLGGEIIGTDTSALKIRMNTSDASDTKDLQLSGGGAVSQGRGSYIISWGNEHASAPGDLAFALGNVSGANLKVLNSSAANVFDIDEYGQVDIGESGGSLTHIVNGNLSVTATASAVKLVATSTTVASQPCPVMTTAQRDAVTPATGECVYNSTDNEYQNYDGSAWASMGGGGGSGFNSILTCGDMECGTLSDYWTSSGSLSKDTTTFLYGKGAAKVTLSATALSFIQTVTNAKYSGKRFRASCDVKSSDATIQLCSYDGTNEIECTDSGKYTGSDEWVELSAYMVAGTSGNVGIKLKSSSMTDDVFIDNCNLYESSNVQDGGLIWPEYSQAAGDFAITRTGGATNWATVHAVARPYKTDSGWRMTFNIYGTFDSGSNIILDFSNVTFKNVSSFYQSIDTGSTDASTGLGYVYPNAQRIDLFFGGAVTNAGISGDVALESKPSFAVDVTDTKVTTEPSQGASQIKWSNIAGCSLTETSASFTTVNDTDCTYASASKIGATAAPTTTGDLSLKVPYVKPGRYELCFEGTHFTSGTSATECRWRLYDGTNSITSPRVIIPSSGADLGGGGFCGIVEYGTAQTNLEILLQVYRVSGTDGCVTQASGTYDRISISLKPVEGFLKGTFKDHITSTGMFDAEGVFPVFHSCRINNNGSASLDSTAKTCSAWLNAPTWTSTGNVSVNIKTGVFSTTPNCTVSHIVTGVNGKCSMNYGGASATIVKVECRSEAPAADDEDFIIQCHGTK